MLLSFPNSLSERFSVLLGVYLFFSSSATKLHFFLGVFCHFITGDDTFFAAETQKASFTKILEQCADGTITPWNYDAYIDPVTYARHGNQIARAWEYAEQARAKATDGKRSCTVIWAYGDTGTGKTTLCRLYAEKLGLTVYMSATGKDPLSKYRGESAVILDDLRSNTFSYEELLKVLDPHYSTPVHSRYHDKVLQCEYIFITTVEHPWCFVKNYRLSDSDSAEQLYRRLNEIWLVTKDTIKTEKYNLEIHKFEAKDTTANPVKSYVRGVTMDPHTSVSSMNILREIEADCNPQPEADSNPRPETASNPQPEADNKTQLEIPGFEETDDTEDDEELPF